MKVNFGNYTYFDGKTDGSYISTPGAGSDKFAFDKNKFNQLIANRQYNDAADYASQFHFNDPATQKAHENDIINLRRNGRILGGIYGQIKDDDTLKKVEFADNVFVDGGLDKLKDNNYVSELERYKAMIGSNIEYNTFGSNDITKEATSLSITFQPETQKFLGIDWLAEDNKNNIDNFYAASGLSENDLKQAGVEVIHKDGRTTLKFDKSNPLANSILYHTPSNYKSNRIGDIPTFILGGDIVPTIKGYDENGNVLSRGTGIEEFKDIINDAVNTKAEYFKKTNLDYKDYSSTAAPMLSDELYGLKEALRRGDINQSQYNAQARAMAPHIFSAIYSLGSADYEMYTNNFNDKNGDELLVPADVEQRAELANIISNYDPNDIDVSAMVSNGKIGALITLEARGQKEKASFIESVIPDKNKGRRIQIFVPGLLQEEAQARINRNTSSRAVQELNSMIDWGYEYKLRNGSVLSVGSDGRFYKDKVLQDKQSTINDINKDMIIENAVSNLKFQYMNSSGNIMDNLKYEQMSRLLAMDAVQDIYGDIKVNVNSQTNDVTVVDKYGTIYNPDDIFSNKVNEETTQYEIFDRFKEIYSIYNELMNELNYYK